MGAITRPGPPRKRTKQCTPNRDTQERGRMGAGAQQGQQRWGEKLGLVCSAIETEQETAIPCVLGGPPGHVGGFPTATSRHPLGTWGTPWAHGGSTVGSVRARCARGKRGPDLAKQRRRREGIRQGQRLGQGQQVERRRGWRAQLSHCSGPRRAGLRGYTWCGRGLSAPHRLHL